MMDSPCSSSGSSSTKLQNKFRKDKGNVSYSDLHSEVKKDVIKTPRLQKEEFVKYMSKLPRFLDKGGKVKERPLNLGVLDWNTLENWQNNHPPRPSSRYSTSSSITASSLWTDGSSNYERGDDTFSPSAHKGRRPSLHSYLNISSIEGHSKHVESHTQNVANDTEIKVITTNRFDTKQNIPRDSAFPTKSSELKLRKCKRQSSDSQKIRSSTDFQNYGLPSSKGKWKVKADASKPGSEKLQNQYSNSTHCGFSDGHNDVVLSRPGERADSNHSFPFSIARRSRESKESISSDGSHLQEVYSTDLYPSTSDSCAITHETDGSQGLRKEQMFPSLSCAIKLVNRAKSKISEEEITVIPTVSTSTKPLKVLNMKSTNTDSEAENPSPSCRLSSVLNRIRRRSYHSRNSSDVLQFRSEDVTANSGSNIADSFVWSDTAKTNHSNAGNTDHFSPLKRLLNPLLKTKGANSRFADNSPKNSISTSRFSASFYKQRELSSVHRPKVKLDFTNLRTPNLDETHRNKIKGSSMLQAHLQVSAKNDLPLFTFAVDNSDVLLATLRKFSSRKNDPTWIYTFFSVHEMRRKSGGWLSQGSKVKDYVPNVVAQMKVSDLPFSSLDEQLTVDQLSIREFVLYAVDLRLFDHETCDRQLSDELAAIVVKFPRKTITGVEDSSKKSRVFSNLRDLQEDKYITGNQELFSTTVLLPGGIHGLPSKGEPSPLIERWFSGGQCDCGGWDLGCKVKVFSNNNKKSDGHFELFSQSQEKAEQATPFFSLSPLKNGNFKVEFDSTLSLLQAFSICVAVFDSIKQSELQQPCKIIEEKLAEEARLPDICGLWTPKLAKVEVPSRFASHPPHTPVERV